MIRYDLPFLSRTYRTSPSATRCLLSFLCLIWASLYVAWRSNGADSGPTGAVVAVAAALFGFVAYRSCPWTPRAQRYLALILAGLNFWLGMDTLNRFFLFGVQ